VAGPEEAQSLGCGRRAWGCHSHHKRKETARAELPLSLLPKLPEFFSTAQLLPESLVAHNDCLEPLLVLAA
jgi:hypothetical protein